MPAGAQADDGGQSGSEQLTIFGDLTDADGEPVAGVRLTVRSDGELLGEATSDAAGAWEVPVPGAGIYEVELDPSTLPEGVTLRDPGRNVLDQVRVLEGRAKRVLFPIGEPVGGVTQVETGNRFVNLFWSGIVLGLVIALASIGLSLVFGTTGLVNFAHGELITFGALVAWFFNGRSAGPSWSLFVAGALGVVAAGLLGGGLDAALWRPLTRRRVGVISLMILSIGLALFLRHLYAVVFEPSPRPFTDFAAQAPWKAGPWVFPPKELVLVGLTVAVIVTFAVALQRTRLGTAIRAVSDNKDLAESSGIDVARVVRIVWIVGAALAGLGGIAFGVTQAVQWDMGFRLLLPVFAAVILGGLGSVYGPLVGGLVIGLVSELSTLWFPGEFKFAWALAALIVVLLVRPQGILGIKERIG